MRHRRTRGERRARSRELTDVPTCPGCDQPYRSSAGCTAPIPWGAAWGNEPYWTDEMADWEPLPHCPDCGCQLGHRHHTHCLKAICLRCEEQAVMCDHDPDDAA